MEDESTLLFRASMAMGRLDEYLRGLAKPDLLREWFVRHESLSIAAAESLASTEINLAAQQIDTQPGLLNKADRTAYDINGALRLALAWGEGAPTDTDVYELWKATERTNTRQNTPDFIWRLERDSAEAAADIRSLMQAPTPWTAVEAIRRLWIRPREFLDGRARRLAMIAAAPIIRTGFGTTAPLVGVARELTRDPDHLFASLQAFDSFFPVFLGALANAAARTYEAGLKIQRLAIDLGSHYAEEKANSRIRDAIDQVIMYPVISVPALASRLSITQKGAAKILSRLEASQSVRLLDADAKKNKVYLCPKALHL